MANISAARGLGLARLNGAYLAVARAPISGALLNYCKPFIAGGLHGNIVFGNAVKSSIIAALSQKQGYRLRPTSLLKRSKTLADLESKKTPLIDHFTVTNGYIEGNKDILARMSAGAWAVAKTLFKLSLLMAFNVAFLVAWGPYQWTAT